jgi:hypothetical protein
VRWVRTRRWLGEWRNQFGKTSERQSKHTMSEPKLFFTGLEMEFAAGFLGSKLGVYNIFAPPSREIRKIDFSWWIFSSGFVRCWSGGNFGRGDYRGVGIFFFLFRVIRYIPLKGYIY